MKCVPAMVKEIYTIELRDSEPTVQEPDASSPSTRSYKIFDCIRFAIAAVLVIGLVTTVFVAVGAIWHGTTVAKDADIVFPFSGYRDVQRALKLIPRSRWGAEVPLRQDNLTLPVDLVIITHTLTPFCYTFWQCSRILRTAQKYDFEAGRSDISDNFLIAGDGNAYEGRGWDSTNDRRNGSISVGLIGNFLYDDLKDSMLEGLSDLLSRSVDEGQLSSDYKIVCLNQTEESSNPGDNVYKVLKDWDHFQEGKFY